MWINLTPDELALVKLCLNSSLGDNGKADGADALIKQLEERETDARSELYLKYRDAAFDKMNRDGELEIDLQSDDTVCASPSEDGGAYVMAWVWIDNSDAGISAEEEPTDEEKREELRDDWKYEVANGDTTLGFEDWITAREESEAGDEFDDGTVLGIWDKQ